MATGVTDGVAGRRDVFRAEALGRFLAHMAEAAA
jgi:hypothetical protein